MSEDLKIGLFIVVAALGFLQLIRWVRRTSTTSVFEQGSNWIAFDQIPRLVDELTKSRNDGSFAVLLFGCDGEPPEPSDALNVQFSIEAGRIGLDWVLIAPLNIESRENVAAYIRDNERPVMTKNENSVEYLRTEGEQLAELCQGLLQELFGVTKNQRLGLIVQGFDWREFPGNSTSLHA